MNKEIFQVTDTGNGQSYFCSSKQAVQKMIAEITGLPMSDDAVREAANGQSNSFLVETHPLYDKNGL